METDQKRVALITGGSRGIGFGIAKELARAGFQTVINGRKSKEEIADALKELSDLGANPLYIQADIAELYDQTQLLDQIKQATGRLDVLVNNAGVSVATRSDLLDATPESYDRVMRINLRGPYFLTQKVASWMIDQRKADDDFQAAIINVSSVSATFASCNRGEYCISKAGVAMATQLWATRLGEYGIPVFEVRPGVIRTDMTAGVKDKYDELFADGLTIEKRWGESEDVGRIVKLLASGEITYATGAVIPIDGGLSVNRL